jgi:hypothetical protein
MEIGKSGTKGLLSVVNREGTGPQGCKVPKKTSGSNLNNASRGESKEPLRLEVNFE